MRFGDHLLQNTVTSGAVGRGHFQSGAGQNTAPFSPGRLDAWLEQFSACPWGAHAGFSPWGAEQGGTEERQVLTAQARRMHLGAVKPSTKTSHASKTARAQLYTPAERVRRDASGWTVVQGVLAPLQFAICAASLFLIVRYLTTGQGYALATGSILLKTAALYAIMITGSIWEREVFGKWLFARAFFWEDVVSMVVLALQTVYLVALLNGWGAPAEQMSIAVAAYVAYAVNASQFLLKLRAARLDAAPRSHALAA